MALAALRTTWVALATLESNLDTTWMALVSLVVFGEFDIMLNFTSHDLPSGPDKIQNSGDGFRLKTIYYK